MENSVSDTFNELLVSFFGLAVTARGPIAIYIAVAVAMLIVAIAWRVVRRS